MGNAKTNLEYLKTTKSLIKQAIIDKGVEVSDTDTFRSYKDKIADIETGGGSKKVFAKYGSPTITGTILTTNSNTSGVLLSVGDYLNFSFETKFTAHFEGNIDILFGNKENKSWGVGYMTSDKILGLWMGSGGGSWECEGSASSGRSTKTLTDGSEYYIRCGCDNKVYFIDVKDNEEDEYTRCFTHTSSSGSGSFSQLLIGSWVESFTTLSEFDLSKTAITNYTNLDQIEI